ncbi:MAG TPA: type II toxin-antitoxin system VapC family toxin [Fodinibius sp.]|nr:type II toxin-antitoxin system VapC family toxin [Fodinibius sp.]
MNSDLIDSNLIIYAAQSGYEKLHQYIGDEAPLVSVISKVETLGYHDLKPNEQTFLEAFFDKTLILSISEQTINKAISLRQQHRMSLGDALIAGTAISHELRLATNNTSDFNWISELEVFDPLSG